MLHRNSTLISRKKPGLLAYLPAVSMLLIITVLLLMPSSDLPDSPFLEMIYFDKWVHLGLFAVLTFLSGFPRTHYLENSQKHIVLIAILCACYGILMEYAQKLLTADRSFETIDMFADAAGVAVGYFALKYYKKKTWQKASVR